MFDKTKEISRQTWISATFLLIISSVVSKAFGFIREMLIAQKFGISGQVDAYMVALSIPVLIGGTIGSAFSVALVPIYHKLTNGNNEQKAKRFINTVFSFTTLISLLAMGIIFFMPETIIKLIAPSLPDSTISLTIELLKWLLLLLMGYSLYNVLSAVYNAIHHFKIPAFTDMFSNLFIIAALIFLTSAMGIYALVTGMISSFYFFLLVFLVHLFYHRLLGFNFDIKTKEFREFISFTAPVLLFMFFMSASGIIENFFASSLKEGSIASLGYAKRLYDIIPTLLIANIAKAVFPTFSTLHAENKTEALRDLVIKLNKQFIIYFLPVTCIVIFYRKEIISLVFMRGAFDETALTLTSSAFMFYSLGLLASTMVPVFFRLCYAFSDSISPLIAIVASVSAMILFNYFLSPFMGISGIALSNTLSVFITLFALGFLVRKKLGGIELLPLLKSFLISALCATLVLIPFIYFSFSNPYYILFLIPAYFVLYLALGMFVSKNEFNKVWMTLRKNI